MAVPVQKTPPGRFHARAVSVLSRKPLTAVRAARLIASATVSVTLVSGIVIHFADERNFPTIGRGMWWAVQTVTTVGYGDVVPETTGGKLVAAVVMVVGIAFIAVMTASITSVFIEAARRRVRGSDLEALADKLDRISASLVAIEDRLADAGHKGHDDD
jgi:voltage-gated potassium channel Kch